MTRAPRATSSAVSAPLPAPTSITNARAGRSASTTSRRAQWLSSWCHPHRRCWAATVTHRCAEGGHGGHVSRPIRRGQTSFGSHRVDSVIQHPDASATDCAGAIVSCAEPRGT
jgi:hypothetical protein